MFKLELLLLVLNDDVAELPFESSFEGMKLISDLEDFTIVGFTSCGILFGDFTGARTEFAVLDIFDGDNCEFPIFVVFTGLRKFGMEEFLLLAVDDAAAAADVGLIDESFV